MASRTVELRTFGTQAARVWSVLPAVFEQLDIPVTLRENGTQMGNALQPQGQRDTRVTAYVDALGRPRSTSGVPAHCNSKGTLEPRIVELVAERLVA